MPSAERYEQARARMAAKPFALPLVEYRGRRYDHLPAPDAAPVEKPAPKPSREKLRRERRRAKQAKLALLAMRNGPRLTTLSKGHDRPKHGLGLSLRGRAKHLAKRELAPEKPPAKEGHCHCGCVLIRDAAFDAEGEATGKLTWACIRCEHARRNGLPDDVGEVGA